MQFLSWVSILSEAMRLYKMQTSVLKAVMGMRHAVTHRNITPFVVDAFNQMSHFSNAEGLPNGD